MTVTNRLLDALPRKTRLHMIERCSTVDFAFGDTVSDADTTMPHVYFPVTGFVSMVIALEQHRPLEMGLIGNEGMLGANLALGIANTPLMAVVQGAGSALRMKTTDMRDALRNHPALARLIGRYLHVMVVQFAQATACLHFHPVDTRLARWLLMTHDRSHADHFHLTHALLADMLGVRRSAVTIAAGNLQRCQLIRYTRGEIEVLSRTGLEKRSCSCYEALRATYSRWLS